MLRSLFGFEVLIISSIGLCIIRFYQLGISLNLTLVFGALFSSLVELYLQSLIFVFLHFRLLLQISIIELSVLAWIFHYSSLQFIIHKVQAFLLASLSSLKASSISEAISLPQSL